MNRYWKPTPKKWRKVGDSLLMISTVLAGCAVFTDHEIMAYVIAGTGAVGKIITNFAKEKEAENGINPH